MDAAIIFGIMTLALTALALKTGYLHFMFNESTSIDAVLVQLLAFGIYKQSRTSATFLLIYFLASRIWLMIQAGYPLGWPMTLIFSYYFFFAMLGTYEHHGPIRRAQLRPE